MPKFAANLSFIFQEAGFLERFAAAAACGFKAVEYLSPYEHPPEVIAEQLNRHGLEQALLNMPPGDWAAGERAVAALPGRETEFRAGVETALTYAKATRCRLVHAMAGLVPEGSDRAAAQYAYVANLRHAAERCRTAYERGDFSTGVEACGQALAKDSKPEITAKLAWSLYGARKLEDARYISCSKSFEGRTPKTEYSLTAAGRRALERYLDHMEALIGRMRKS